MRQTERGGTERTGQLGAFLLALALLLVLTVFAHRVVLGLAAVIAGPLPAARTALSLSRKAMQETVPDETPGSIASEPVPESAPEAAAPANTGMESYLAALEADDARPADAGAVQEKTYPHGSGEKYIPCGGGSIKNNTRVPAAEVAAEITNPLPFAVEWNSPDPQILIMHTHATEDYRLSAGLWYRPGDGARSTDRSINMCAVGRVMADTLNAAGLNTLHDETLNDYPSYTGSYANSRAVVQQYLEKYPSIKIVLDVHRDAIEDRAGHQYKVITREDPHCAQISFVMGSNNDHWLENVKLAVAVQQKLTDMSPTLMRPLTLRNSNYNQHLTTGSMLVEIGAAGNSLDEALRAARLFAAGLAQVITGT